jgi:hypothetical protein
MCEKSSVLFMPHSKATLNYSEKICDRKKGKLFDELDLYA